MRREGATAIPADAATVRPRRRSPWRILRRVLAWILPPLLLPALIILIYRFVPPPVTPLMLIRAAEVGTVRREWVDLARIAPALPRAVIASEDARFCGHRGFDWVEIDKAYESYREGERLRGASTISQQVARNLFLWPGGGFIRKGVEAYITVLVEGLLSKERILEIYLNIAEWGPGVFGAEVAAQTHFSRHAQQLTPREAALLAAVLPNPREWRPEHPTAYLNERADTIMAGMSEVAVPGKRGCR